MLTSPTTELLKEARACFDSGEFTLALDLAETQLALHLHSPQAWELKGLIHHALQQYASARLALEQAAEMMRLGPDTLYVLAGCFIAQRDFEQAVHVLLSLLSEHTPTELLQRVADAFQALQRPDLAVRTYRFLLRRDPDSAPLAYAMACAMVRASCPSRLVEGMACRAISLAPDESSYRLGLAIFYHSLHRIDEAFQVIATLTVSQLGSLQCPHALQRINDIYQRNDATSRAAFCQQLLMNLQSALDAT